MLRLPAREFDMDCPNCLAPLVAPIRARVGGSPDGMGITMWDEIHGVKKSVELTHQAILNCANCDSSWHIQWEALPRLAMTPIKKPESKYFYGVADKDETT